MLDFWDIFKILNNSVYFQNIVVCNEPLRFYIVDNKIFAVKKQLAYVIINI